MKPFSARDDFFLSPEAIAEYRENAGPDEESAQGHGGRVIDSQNSNGRAADWRSTYQHRILPSEMFAPNISPWMEQPDDFVSRCVNA